MQLEPLYVPVKRPRTFYPAFARDLYDSLKNVVPRQVERQDGAHRKILVVNGHPDPRPERFCAALCEAYEAGAQSAQYDVRRLDVGALALAEPEAAGGMDAVLDLVRWSNRLVIVFPLWLDGPPEQLRLLFDQIAQAGFHERIARLVVTMEMPAFAHRAACHPARNSSNGVQMTELSGVKADKPVFIGCVNTISADQRKHWLQSVHDLGTES